MLSILIGSISAIYQKRLKRLFAYSTIAHTGFIVLAFLAASLDASKALVFYIVVYSSLTIITFSILINVASATQVQPKYLINFSGIGYKNYIFSATFGLTILAIAGIPPLAGFFSKLGIFSCLLFNGYIVTPVLIAIFSSIACFYYIRLIRIFFFVENTRTTF
jgi:NADH-quinone oxidoreductase subunit N